MLEASSIEYIDKISSEHFYNENDEEIYWIKKYYTKEKFINEYTLYFEYNVTKNTWDFFISMASWVSPFINFSSKYNGGITPIYSKDIKDEDLLKKFDSIIPNYKDLIIEDKAYIKKYKEMFPADSIIRYENKFGIVNTEATWHGFRDIRLTYRKLNISDNVNNTENINEISCFHNKLRQSSISEVKDVCKKFVENKHDKYIERVNKLNKKIEECKSKIESINKSIVDYQKEISELNNYVNDLDYNTTTFTNKILQLL